jgi:hypothetical protein
MRYRVLHQYQGLREDRFPVFLVVDTEVNVSTEEHPAILASTRDLSLAEAVVQEMNTHE